MPGTVIGDRSEQDCGVKVPLSTSGLCRKFKCEHAMVY